MHRRIVQSSSPITLLGAGGCTDQMLRLALAHAPRLVAADGGANVAHAAGVIPDAVIGDLDSVSEEALAAIPQAQVWRIAEQDSTDFEKCLSRIEAPYILALGFTGARVDHLLAVLSVIARLQHTRCIAIGADDVIFLASRKLTLDLAKGTRVSLFPMGKVRGLSTGLRWPIDGIAFDTDGRIGTSNEALGRVELEFDNERMLVLLPPDCLGAAIAALAPEASGSAVPPSRSAVPGE